MNEWKKWMKIMKMVSQEEGNSLLTSQSKWKKIKPTGAILLANVFHIHYLFWAKPHPKTGAILWVSHENFTLTLIDPFSHTLFPNTKIRATFGSFCVFHIDIHKLHLLLGVCEERHAHMAIPVSSKHFPKISSLSLTYDFKHACTDVVKEKVKYIHFKH